MAVLHSLRRAGHRPSSVLMRQSDGGRAASSRSSDDATRGGRTVKAASCAPFAPIGSGLRLADHRGAKETFPLLPADAACCRAGPRPRRAAGAAHSSHPPPPHLDRRPGSARQHLPLHPACSRAPGTHAGAMPSAVNGKGARTMNLMSSSPSRAYFYCRASSIFKCDFAVVPMGYHLHGTAYETHLLQDRFG